jgi:hypothetical protein
MSEYLDAEIHETDESVELRWRYNGITYGIIMGQELFDVLQREPGARTAILTEVLVHDADGDGTFWS